MKNCQTITLHEPATDWTHPDFNPPPVEGEVTKEILEQIKEKYGDSFQLRFVKKDAIPKAFNPMLVPACYAATRHVIYDPAVQSFFIYEAKTGLYRSKSKDSMRLELVQLTHEVAALFDGDPFIERFIQNIAVGETSDNKIRSAVSHLISITGGKLAGKPKGFIHCRNGMLKVATGELLPFDPKYLSRNATPVSWDNNGECPRFLGELLGKALGADDISVIQRYAGAALLGTNLTQKFVMLTGRAGGGKSQLVKVIELLIGAENCTQLRTKHLSSRFEVARFVGKTLLTGIDVKGRFLQTDGAEVIKALCGGDRLTTETKTTMNTDDVFGDFSILITSNSRLRVALDGDEEAWRRRGIMITYDREKPKVTIADFSQVLIDEEGAGILRWAVEGARQLLKADWRLTTTPEQDARMNALIDESNSVLSFVRERIEVKEGATAASSEVVQAYTIYCDAQGWSAETPRIAERKIADAMMDVHHKVCSHSIQRREDGKDRSVRGFRGVKVATDEEVAGATMFDEVRFEQSPGAGETTIDLLPDDWIQK